MKYVPKEVDASVNIPGGDNGKTVLSVAISLLFALAVVCGVFFLVIEHVVELIPISIEREYHVKWSGKKRLSTYREANIESLIKSLIKSSNLEDFPFSVTIKTSKTRNAFIMPGGKIIIHSKLLEEMSNENELAFVMAHEIGHFYKRHHLKSFGKGIAFSLLSSLVFSHSEGAREIVASSATFSQLSFSRRDESQADEFAASVLQNHYGHIQGFNGLFNILKKEKKSDGKILQFFQTHPASDNRIIDIKELAIEKGFKLNGEVKNIAPYLSESK